MPNIMLHPIDPVFITQGFGLNKDVYAAFGLKGHNGIDYRTTFDDSKDGKRDVFAPYWGKVIEAADQGKKGYGRFLRLDLLDGSQVVLGHLDSFKVKIGDTVKTGQVIAISGNTGFSTGAHLHFGYRPPKWNPANGFAGYVDQMALMTSDIKKVTQGNFMPNKDSLADQFNGKILVAAQDRGRKWYVWDGMRYEIDKAPSFELKLQQRPVLPFVVFISNVDLEKIPVG